MSIRGQRVEIDFDDGGPTIREPSVAAPVIDFVGDIQERKPSPATPPKPPGQRKAENGFPAHKKRLGQSRFKQFRSGNDETATNAQPNTQEAPPVRSTRKSTYENEEKRQIDMENQMKLDAMDPDEIAQEQRELLGSLNPSLVQALLRRAEYKPGGDDADFPGLEEQASEEPARPMKPKGPPKKVTFFDDVLDGRDEGNGAEDGEDEDTAPSGPIAEDADEDQAELLSTEPTSLPIDSIHFPRPAQPPELDPSSETFLEDLHQKYFPSLPADPDKLEWMRSTKGPSSYSPVQTALDPKDIRFDFSGSLLPPRAASQIPVTAGLHHHGDAPDSAGYTIAELARLARSAVPGQRCIAFRTLGRILYRLGKGEFGNPSDGTAGTVGAEDTFGELARGLWREVEKEQIVEICTAESDGKGMGGRKHVSAQAYATEAVWLWQKGGGRRHKSD
ncbi:hypothetical protein C1H76_3171 [Elsinoe australis]|uniref:RPAP1-like protein n=1 Tax=Elsinoe australis TaxID=40998 RepID=A0A4U7B0K4_9PEZI|nr:hypothetical protein C1H76_3171 [Elsinoe australis]